MRRRTYAALVLALGALVVPGIARPAAAAPGDLDPSFGTGGIVVGERTEGASEQYGKPAITDQDGLVVVRSRYNSNDPHPSGLVVERFTSSGQLDPSFGQDGRALVLQEQGFLSPRTLHLRDGKVIVTGSFPYVHEAQRQFVVRLLADGSLDDSFGDGGLVDYQLGTTSSTMGTSAVDADGNVLVLEQVHAGPGGPSTCGVRAFDSTGTADVAFGTGGIAKFTLGDAQIGCREIAVTSDGGFVVLGYAQFGVPVTKVESFVVRFAANGTLDSGFGDGGQVSLRGVGHADLQELAVLGDGTIVAAGRTGERVEDFYPVLGDPASLVIRLLPDGRPDPVLAGTGSLTWHQNHLASESAAPIGVAPDGTTYFAGGRGVMTSDGEYDTTFTSDDQPRGRLAVDHRGRVVITVGLQIARLEGAVPAPPATTTTPPTPTTSPTTTMPPPTEGTAADPAPSGYWLTASDGGIFSFGDAAFHGSTGALALNQPIVAMAPTKTGKGYWFTASDGGIFSFGDAAFHGSTGALSLNQPIVAMMPTPTSEGYWLVARDGGIFAFGDAGFFGSTGGMPLNQPIVAAMATSSGQGYWLIASDGGIFAFGDAAFFGSTGGLSLNQPIVAAAPTPTGEGYWLFARDGGVFAFGDARFHGGTGALSLNEPIVAVASTGTGDGYWLFARDGGVFSFGDAQFLGGTGGIPLNQPIVSAAAVPR